MNPDRRSFLQLALSLPFLLEAPVLSARTRERGPATPDLGMLETSAGGRLGVFAIDTGSGRETGHREDERFPFCSTFKVILVAAILDRSARESGFLEQRVTWKKDDLVSWSPVTEKHAGDGLTVAELCAAAIEVSDNTASNLLIRLLGGPAAITGYARSLGNREFRLDRWETDLNTALPGDPRDTVTPRAMAASLRALTLGDALPPARRELLIEWLRGSTTGGKRIRAGVPAGWQVGDKTGTGAWGTTNDIGILWPPEGAPIVLAVYSSGESANAPARDSLLAAATRTVLQTFGVV